MGCNCMGLFVKGKEASKAHDFIKEFNAIERVTDGPVAHPQDARSTLSLSLSLSLSLLLTASFGLMQMLGSFLLDSHKSA
jgi:hypothetical protein